MRVGSPTSGGKPPSGDELQGMAKKAGMPDAVAKNIKAGGSAVNDKAMDDADFEYLYGIDDVDMGTPTVYDLNKGEKLDIDDDDWLSKLIESWAAAVASAVSRTVLVSTSVTPSSAALAINQPTTEIEPAAMMASAALRCCTRTISGLFPSTWTLIRIPVSSSDGYSTPPEFRAIRDAFGCDGLDGRAPRAGGEHIRSGHAHVALDLAIVASRHEHEQHRLQRHQARRDHDAGADPPQDPLRSRLAWVAVETREQAAPQNASTLRPAVLFAPLAAPSCSLRFTAPP
jgi:hypothetical protein